MSKYLTMRYEVIPGISCEGICLTTPWCQSISIYLSLLSLPVEECWKYEEYARNMRIWIKKWYGGSENCICAAECGLSNGYVITGSKHMKFDITGKVKAKDMKTSKTIFWQFISDFSNEAQNEAARLGMTFKTAKRK